MFVLDEVHSLSSKGFQALLKSLEKPPRNVVFILCTTEIHKVTATIIPHCQRFNFKRIGMKYMIQNVNQIVNEESISITTKYYIRLHKILLDIYGIVNIY